MIIIESYNPNWPKDFEVIQSSLQNVLGVLALRIDHIGSTSVPGLGAKDVIDIQITVKELLPAIEEKLIGAGYRSFGGLRSDHVPSGEDPNPDLWTKFFFNEPKGQRKAHIHVRKLGNPNQKYPLLFRDYLRTHPKSAQTIELIKRQLARYHADDVEAYYDIKDPVYDLIWEAALEWATYTNWRP
jgi:GrpB-like predicted nucleotidyltransferase (UPF0157 family)